MAKSVDTGLMIFDQPHPLIFFGGIEWTDESAQDRQ
jgi:hypothetical protein